MVVHLNDFQGLINQLSAMSMSPNDELHALLLLSSLLRSGIFLLCHLVILILKENCLWIWSKLPCWMRRQEAKTWVVSTILRPMSFFIPEEEVLKSEIPHIIEISLGGDRNQSSRARLYAITTTIRVILRNSVGKRKEINPKRWKKRMRLQLPCNNNS